MGLLAVPVLTRFRKNQELSCWFFLAWLSFALGATFLMRLCEANVAIATSAGVLVLVAFAFSGPRQLGFFRLPSISGGALTRQWLKMSGTCLLCTFAAILFHLSYSPIRHYIWGKDSHHPNGTLQLLLNYWMLGDSSLMKMVYMLGFIFIIAVCVPILEEVTFRGVLESSLAPKLKRWQAVLISATIFGFLHQGLEMLLPKIFFGIVVSWLTQRYQSLIPAILTHGLNNLIVTCYVLFLVLNESDGLYAKAETERLVKVKKDQEEAQIAHRLDLRSHQRWESETRLIYEPKLRSQMDEWGIPLAAQDNVLNAWEKASIQCQIVQFKLIVETPTEIGDRRNVWKVKAWEKKRKEHLKAIRTDLDLLVKSILGSDERVAKFRDIGLDAKDEHTKSKRSTTIQH